MTDTTAAESKTEMTFKKKMKIVLKRLERDGYFTHQFPCECCGEPIYAVVNPAFPVSEHDQRLILNDHVGNRVNQYTMCFNGGAEDAARIMRRLTEIGCIVPHPEKIQ